MHPRPSTAEVHPVADGGTAPSNKVARLIEAYGLSEIADDLESAWTATGDDHASLRELAARFNRHLLAEKLEEAGREPVAGEVAALHSTLVDDDVSEGEKVRTRRRLAEAGVDVDQLEDDFVSYQTIRRFLRQHRNATYQPERSDPGTAAKRQVRKLQGRIEAVTTTKVEQLRNADHVTIDSFQVTSNVRVHCSECGANMEAEVLFERGACECP